MTLKDRILSDVEDVFLDTDDCAEEITAQPPGGGAPVVFDGLFEELEAQGIVIEGWAQADERIGLLQHDDSQTFVLGTTFTIGTEVWHYAGVAKREAGLVHVRLRIPGVTRGTVVRR